MPTEGQTAGRLTSGGLTLAFTWAVDRFTHVVTTAGETFATTTADGVETPVYQEVHQQGDLVFASGRSGDAQWSASIEAVDGGFLFDVACRIGLPTNRLGVAYQVGEAPAAGGLVAVALDEPLEAATRVAIIGPVIAITPAATPGAPPTTVRMRYRLEAAQP